MSKIKILLIMLSFVAVPFQSGAASLNMIDYTAYPPFASSRTTPNVLIIFDNSNSMDEAFNGNAAGSFSSDSKAVTGKNALIDIINEFQGKLRIGVMSYRQSGADSAYIHNSPYFASYDPVSGCSDPPPECVDYCRTGDSGSKSTCETSCQTNNPVFDVDYFDEIITNYSIGSEERDRYCGLVYPKTNNIPNPDDPSNNIYFKQALPFYADANYNEVFCYSDSYNPNENAPWDSYACYRDKTGTSDGDSGYSSLWFNSIFWPTDTDFAAGFADFGRRMSWYYIGRTWFRNDSPGDGYLNEPVDDVDEAHLTALLAKLEPHENNETGYMTCADPGNSCDHIIMAGLTPTAGTLQTATDYFEGAESPIQYECQKNFIVYVTDGLPSVNENGGTDTADNLMPNVLAKLDSLRNITKDLEGTDYTFDVRTYVLGVGLTDNAKLKLDDMAMQGGTDVNGQAYYADDAAGLSDSLKKIFYNLSKESSSGTAVSVLATTGEGEGAIYQAYFLPEKLEGIEPRKWLGYVQALFVDKYGNLREDTNDNDTLDLTSDYIVEMGYDTDLGSIVDKYADADGDGVKDTPDSPVSTVSLDDISALWKGGDRLWDRDASDRTIFTTLDGYTSIDFTATNAAGLQNDLRAFDVTEAANIINWVRGDDLTDIIDSSHDDGYRKRDLTIDEINKVWKLGDIIHSTPTIVSKAVENYDLLYGDLEYADYRSKHLTRRMVLYAGANDGMLHAFNAGCFNSTEHKFYSDVNSSGVCFDDATEPLGHELWAFIPHNVMPHLKWNTMPGYTHVYNVDLKPKVTDIKVFEPDDKHVSGYGTILIGGLRYGGNDIQWCSINPDVLCTQDSQCSTVGAGTCTGGSASPEYYALDVTDPADPRILWSFTNADLGLSMSNPSIAKIGDSWYAIFGSGATDFDTGADLTAFQAGTLFVLDLSSGTDGVISSWVLNDNYWKISTGNATSFLSDAINVDVDMDFDTDVVYIGENYQQGSNWNALMQRITTNKGTNEPSTWKLSTLANVGTLSSGNDKSLKITSAPSVAMDNNANLFVYFGTGQYYGANDKNQIDTGGFYALKDSCWGGDCDTAVTSILDVSASSVDTGGDVVVSGSCGGAVSTWPDLLTASYACGGWAIYFEDLSEQVDFTGETLSHSGERVLGKPLVLGGLVLWTTFIPGADICANIGESNIYAVYYATGTSYNNYVFKEQANQANPSSTVARVKKLGSGMPSSISAQITSGGTAKGFVQQSTGSILEIESITPLSITSGVTGWKNKKIE